MKLNNRLKIVLVIADSSRTGAPRQVYCLAKALQATHDITVICPEGPLTQQLTEAKVAFVLIDNQLPLRRLVRQIAQYYQELQPQVIHCHGVRGGILGRLARRPRGSKLVYTEHQWTPAYHIPSRVREAAQLGLLRFLSRGTDHTVAVSEAVKQFILQRRITSSDRVSVIYGGIEPYEPIVPVAEPVIGTMSRLAIAKGVDCLLGAMAILAQRKIAFKGIIGGEGPESSSLQQLAKQLGIDQYLTWAGEVVDVPQFFKQLQVYVHPSRYEAFGLAPLEAMSAGLPVIVSAVDGLKEIVRDNENGLSFEVSNTQGLADKLELLLTDEKERQRLAEAGRISSQRFSVKAMAEHYVALYQKLLELDIK